MASRLQVRALLLPLALSAVCAAQQYTPPPPPLASDPCTVVPANPKIPAAPDPKAKKPVCPPPQKDKVPDAPAPADGKPSAAQQFPYPGENKPADDNKPAAEKFPYPGEASPQTDTKAPAASDAGKSAADKFPYPGETKDSPGIDDKEKVQPAPGVPDGSSSGSSGSSSSSGDTPEPKEDPDTTADRKPLPRRGRPEPKQKTLEQRVDEDLDVAKFYASQGNYSGAYLRAKEAAELMPDAPDTHLALAQYAQKLQKKDEAVAEYNQTLKLDPDGANAKAAKRGLEAIR